MKPHKKAIAFNSRHKHYSFCFGNDNPHLCLLPAGGHGSLKDNIQRFLGTEWLSKFLREACLPSQEQWSTTAQIVPPEQQR